MCMLSDTTARVRAQAVLTLVNILRMVNSITAEHGRIFLDYMLPDRLVLH